MAFFAFWVFAFFLIISAGMVVLSRNPVHAVLYLILAFFNSAALFLLMGAEFLAMLIVIVYVGAVAVLFLFVVMMLDIKPRRQSSVFSFDKARQALGNLKNVLLYLIPFGTCFAGFGYLMFHFSWAQSYLKILQWQALLAGTLFLFSRAVAYHLTKINFFDTLRQFFKSVPLVFIVGFVIICELVVLVSGHHLTASVSHQSSGIILKGFNTEALGRVLFSTYLTPFILSGVILLIAMVGAIVLTLRTREDVKRQDVRSQLARNKKNSIDKISMPLAQGLDGIPGRRP